jgi:hypothetical protein
MAYDNYTLPPPYSWVCSTKKDGGTSTMLLMACCDSNGSCGWGAPLLMGAHCKGKGRVRGGAALSMVHCNCNGWGGTTLLIAHCDGNSREDAVLSMGTHYTGKCSGTGGTMLLMGTRCKG